MTAQVVFLQLAEEHPDVAAFLAGKTLENRPAHCTLAHKATHGSSAVAGFGRLVGTEVAVQLTAFYWNDQLAAWEVDWEPELKERGVATRNTFCHITVRAASAGCVLLLQMPAGVPGFKGCRPFPLRRSA